MELKERPEWVKKIDGSTGIGIVFPHETGESADKQPL
jgi:hypothetical protein